MKTLAFLPALVLLVACAGNPPEPVRSPYSSSILHADECELLPERSRNDCLIKQAFENLNPGLCRRVSIESEQRSCLLQLESRN